jgi:hypothetical protein
MGTDAKSASESYFLSYSRSDERFALRLATDLRSRGVAMWIDQLDIRPSEHWDRAVERAVRSCRGLVVVLSPRSAESDNVADEISFAIDSGKKVLPVMIERCTMPLRITRMQVIDATGDYERALDRCFNELAKDDEREPEPSRQSSVGAALDQKVLTLAKERLAKLVGPIAAVLVSKASRQAGSVGELYALLADHIEAKSDRDSFLAHVPKANEREPAPAKAASVPLQKFDQPATIPTAEIEKMSELMTRFIGPIATRVVKRESRSSTSLPQLRGQLAQLIHDEEERAQFLKLAEGR